MASSTVSVQMKPDDQLPRFRSSQLRFFALTLIEQCPEARDYILQAPVLMAEVVGNLDCRVNSEFALEPVISPIWLEYFAQRCRAKPKLRALLASYGFAYQLRALTAVALEVHHLGAIKCLSSQPTLHPSALAQAVPASEFAQTVWLDTLFLWWQASRRHGFESAEGLKWAAVKTGGSRTGCGWGHGEITEVADFFVMQRDKFDLNWSFEQAYAAAQRWHNELGQRTFLTDFQRRHGVSASAVIDYAPLPRHTFVSGFEFVALDSGVALFEEGQAMHHCVATYAPQVISGGSRIYSIRKDVQRVATLELGRMQRGSFCSYAPVQLQGPCNTPPDPAICEAVLAFARQLPLHPSHCWTPSRPTRILYEPPVYGVDGGAFGDGRRGWLE